MKRDLLLGRSFAVSVASVLLYVLARNFVESNKKRMRREAHDTAASSSSAASAGGDSYDVFLSFSGKDTRLTFTDHLYNGLLKAGICVFIDNEIPKGEKFGTSLFQAIKNSKISIPILSQNYASSEWCLEELVEMTECIKSGHIVLPIFYHVEPTHVRNQQGSFGKTFSCLSSNYVKEDVVKWKQALQEVASLEGWEPRKTADGHEAALVDMVIGKVLRELKKAFLVVPGQLVGVEHAEEDILRLLNNNPSATQVVGIHGMGGIGKTTLAKVIYNKLSNQFQDHSFIADIRESSQQHNGIPKLQKQLIFDILKRNEEVSSTDEGISIITSRCKDKKVLILLDDVDDYHQVKALVGKHDWFGTGSKIIITTRISSVLDQAEGTRKYALNEMDVDNSLILFSRHAFRRDFPPCGFKSLSDLVVSNVRGLPLALEVIGSNLCGRDEEYWQAILMKLQNVPHDQVRKRLQISYDALNNDDKQIFLDIACFFIGADLRYASYMWDACKLHPKLGIETLSFMSLIKIGDDGKVQMHDQLRDLGREIVREEHKVPTIQSRLWVHEEAFEVFQRNKGIRKDRVLALCLDKDWTESKPFFFFGEPWWKCTTEQFETLSNLRFLTVCCAKLIGDSRSLLPELRWVMWRGGDAFVATNFCLEKLVILDLSGNNISELWEGWSHLKMAKQLKVLDLSYCHSLKVTPNLLAFRKLEIFHLRECGNLKQIDPSIRATKSLVLLDLQKCRKLQELPQEMCELEELKELYIGQTAIVEIPPCIGSLKKLEVLYADGCLSLVGLPVSISHLVNLLTLDLRFCPRISKLPNSIGSLVNLQRLLCGFENPHYYITKYDSTMYDEWEKFGKLKSNVGICELPESIGDLKNLEILNVANCEKLNNLPSTISKLGNLEVLDAKCCGSLGGQVHIDGLSSLKIFQLRNTNVSGFHGTFDKLSRLEVLELVNCFKLESLLELPASLTVLTVTNQHCTLPQLSHLTHLKELTVWGCPLLKSMPELPSGLLKLKIGSCDKLKESPSLSRLEFLSEMSLCLCGELTEIRGLEGLKSLESLRVNGCRKLSNLDGLEHLESLRRLDLLECPILNDDQFAGLEKLDNLITLKVVDCESLVRVDVPQLTHLWELNFCGCHKLLEIKGLEGLKNLRLLNVVGCPSITLPDLSCFTDLQAFVDECSNIPDGRGVTKAKYSGQGTFEYRPRVRRIRPQRPERFKILREGGPSPSPSMCHP